MIRTILALLCALALLPAALPAAAEDAPPATSLEMARLMGNGINLGNTFEACDNGMHGGNITYDPAHYETLWGQPVTTRKMIRGMKEAGFDTLRIPVAWMTNATHLARGENDYTVSPAYLDRVEEVVSWALEEGMFVILNDHWDGGWWGMFGSASADTRALAMEAYKGLWSQLAERFAKYDWHLIFEGANEELGARFDENSPLYCQDSTDTYLTDGERYTLTNQVNQAFTDTVRAAGGNNADRFLLIPGFGTNIAQTFDSRFRMPSDSAQGRLLLSVHCYTPWSYCGASSAATATKWGTKKDFQTLESELKMMGKYAAQGIGVVIGEYGALPGSDGVMKDNAVTYHRYMLDLCDYYDYCPVLWDCSGFYVRRQLAFSDPDMAALYLEKRRDAEGSAEEVKAAARAAADAALEAAPETFLTDAVTLTDDTCVAWIMWNSGDWAQSYSVGDTYSPDTVSAGLKTTDAVIDGEGTYTVALDFTDTEGGASRSVAFSALGIANGEILHPGWAVHFQSVKINGEEYKLSGRPYTCSDDGKCTRVNLFNEWVTNPMGVPNARVMYGPNIGLSATVINRSDEVIQSIRTIEITFLYGPKK